MMRRVATGYGLLVAAALLVTPACTRAEAVRSTAGPPAPTTTAAAPRARAVVEEAWTPFATAGGVTLLHPADRVEHVGFHQSNNDGAGVLTALPTAVAPVTLEDRERDTGARTAADVVVDPTAEIRAPVTGRVKRAGGYVIYCKYHDDYVVIEPEDHPGWEVKVLHIDGVQVRAGARVVAGRTVLAPHAADLPFESQVDEVRTADPAWPHVHVEVVDPTIKDRPSPNPAADRASPGFPLKSGAGAADERSMRRMAAVATVALALLGTIPGPATADTAAKSQDQPSSTWAQPGTAPLDALGAILYVVAPPPNATQGSIFGYEYGLSYRLEDGTLGLVAVGYQNGRKVAGFAIVPSQPTAVVPYDWQFGRPYFLYTKRFDATRYAAWIQDVWTGAVTFIALVPVPPGAGGIAPASATTWVDYDASLAPTPTADRGTCAFYPEVDVFFFAPIGWRGPAASLATLSGNSVWKGDCPSATYSIYRWQYYRLGTTAA